MSPPPREQPPSAECHALALVDDDVANKVERSEAVDIALLYAAPRTAAGIAVFGIGIGALPLLARCQGPKARSAPELQAVLTYASVEQDSSGGSDTAFFSAEELRRRFGSIDPAGIAAELQLDALAVSQRSFEASQDALKAEVGNLERWRDVASSAVASLEKRAALEFLGLNAGAAPDAIAKSYRSRALAAHPDKGGSEEDFLQLQEMLGRLQETEEEENPQKENLFQNIMRQCRENKKRREEAANKPEPPDIPEEARIKQRRLALHDTSVGLLRRAEEAQQQLSGQSASKTGNGQAMYLVRTFVDDFIPELQRMPCGGLAALTTAERILSRFVRQGVEVLTVAAVVDATATVAHVAVHFTGPLLQAARKAGPCHRLQHRCRDLLEALADVPVAVESFIASFQGKLEDQKASEWLGCDERKAPANQKAAQDAAAAAAAGAETLPAQPEAAVPAPPEAAAPTPPESAADGAATGDAPKGDVAAGSAPRSFAPGQPAGGKHAAAELPPAPCEELVVRAEEEHSVARSAPDPRDPNAPYSETPEWGKLRAACIRSRICVNFNRDQADARCKLGPGQCTFRHACGVCGSATHGGWNCFKLQGWLMAHR